MQEAMILLVESKNASNSLRLALEKMPYPVEVLTNVEKALLWIKASPTPIVLLVFDASGMRSNGARNCRRLRRSLGLQVPVIHCRAQGLPVEELAEATVYLEQPFTPRKLLNRVKALLPANSEEEEVVRCAHMTLYRSKHSIEVEGQGERPLTPKLIQLIEEFFRNPNKTITRRQLMQNVWKTDYVGDTRTLDVHIRWIREIIEKDASDPQLLRTMRSQGYMFIPPAQLEPPPNETP